MQDKAKNTGASTKPTLDSERPSTTSPVATKQRSGWVRNGLALIALGLIATSLFMGEPADTEDAASIQAIKASFKTDGAAAREQIEQIESTQTANGVDTAFEQGESFETSGEPINAYLMYFYAARQGHVPSAMKLANIADPLATPSGEAEPYQAYKWYKTAADSGVEQAKEKLARLREWAEASALKGDPEAKRLLLQWQS